MRNALSLGPPRRSNRLTQIRSFWFDKTVQVKQRFESWSLVCLFGLMVSGTSTLLPFFVYVNSVTLYVTYIQFNRYMYVLYVLNLTETEFNDNIESI